jgi:hypothetical protein
VSVPPLKTCRLSCNIIPTGSFIPLGREINRSLVPPNVLATYEVRPRRPTPPGHSQDGTWVPGLSYSVDEDGQPIRDERTVRCSFSGMVAWSPPGTSPGTATDPDDDDEESDHGEGSEVPPPSQPAGTDVDDPPK